MINRIVFAFFLLSSVYSFAQTHDTVSVYFSMNEREVFNAMRLDSLISTLTYTRKARIFGYTDYVGSVDYNQQLSNDRAKAVAKYATKKSGGKLKITSINGGGELPNSGTESDAGDSISRRVDIIIAKDEFQVKKEISERQTEALEIDTTKESNVVLEGVSFMPGRHYPLPEAKPALDQLLTTMQKYSTLKVEIQGFICCDYSQFDGMDNDTQTMNLSENRAKFIYEFLIREGIDPKRLSYKGYGSSKPKVFPEISEDDRQANRRVEIRIIK
ncbi:MAG: OmpA family protein [Flavobacteriales bacterium]